MMDHSGVAHHAPQAAPAVSALRNSYLASTYFKWTLHAAEASVVKGAPKLALTKDPFTGTVFVFRSRKADRLKLIYWDGSGIVMAYKRLEEHTFTWPGIKDGLMTLTHAQFEALFAGLDWRKVHAVQTRTPEAIE
jgi:transposase